MNQKISLTIILLAVTILTILPTDLVESAAILTPTPAPTDEDILPTDTGISPSVEMHFVYIPLSFRNYVNHRIIFYIDPGAWDYWNPYVCDRYLCEKTNVHPILMHKLTYGYKLYMMFVYDDAENAFVFPFIILDEREVCAAWVCASYTDEILTISNTSDTLKTIMLFVDEILLPLPSSEQQRLSSKTAYMMSNVTKNDVLEDIAQLWKEGQK